MYGAASLSAAILTMGEAGPSSPPVGKTWTVFVRTLGSQKLRCVLVDEGMSTLALWERHVAPHLWASASLRTPALRLAWGGRTLEVSAERTVADHGIPALATLEVLGRLPSQGVRLTVPHCPSLPLTWPLPAPYLRLTAPYLRLTWPLPAPYSPPKASRGCTSWPSSSSRAWRPAKVRTPARMRRRQSRPTRRQHRRPYRPPWP